MIKGLLISLLIISCSNDGISPTIDPINPETSPNEYVFSWIDTHKDTVSARHLYELERLFIYIQNKPDITIKFAIKLSKILYLNEVEIIKNTNNKNKILGQCAHINDMPIGISILNFNALKQFNIEKFGIYSTKENLEATISLIYIHEYGHCFLGLEHIETDDVIIMNSKVNINNILEFMENTDKHIEALIEASEQ